MRRATESPERPSELCRTASGRSPSTASRTPRQASPSRRHALRGRVAREVDAGGGALVLLTNGDEGRALYRSLFTELVDLPPLELVPRPDASGDLARFAGEYGWPDRRWTIGVSGDGLRLERDDRVRQALPIDENVFHVEPESSDNPTVMFHEDVLYVMVWGLPRLP